MGGRTAEAARELRRLEDAILEARGALRRAAGATWVARAGESYRSELDRQQRRLGRLLVDLEATRRAVLR
ncbi:hypothetical protein, partial [Actinotalea ferrariae]|uniref:hypothetical protein n=1 Tax=Actinotalea ferrariae TaxID=1386098 RepID=UPI0005527B82